jgi:hypothetical protein
MVAEAEKAGFAIYSGDVYVAERDSATCSECSIRTECNWSSPEDPTELVFLVENGDSEPCTHYDVKFFEKTGEASQHHPFWEAP